MLYTRPTCLESTTSSCPKMHNHTMTPWAYTPPTAVLGGIFTARRYDRQVWPPRHGHQIRPPAVCAGQLLTSSQAIQVVEENKHGCCIEPKVRRYSMVLYSLQCGCCLLSFQSHDDYMIVVHRELLCYDDYNAFLLVIYRLRFSVNT